MTGWPEAVIALLEDHLVRIDSVDVAVSRELNPLDVHGTVGITASEWVPQEYEMGPLGHEPTVVDHVIQIQHVVKNFNEEECLRLHRNSAKSIRLMVYRDQDFIVGLRGIQPGDDVGIERLLKYAVTGQRFASNKIDSSFVAMSVTDVTFTTEILHS